jgi:hypothetical protein
LKFGPYTTSSAKTITSALKRLGYEYTQESDSEVLAEQEAAWKSLPITTTERGQSYDPAFIFLTLDDKLFDEPNADLAELGLATTDFEPDFSKEDYVCPKCTSTVSHEQGFCAAHNLALIPWSEKVKAQQEAPPSEVTKLISIGFIFLFIGVIAWVILNH